MPKRLLKIGGLIVCFVVLFLTLNKPSNNRVWETGYEVLPNVSINNTAVEIKNIRDFRYKSDKIVSFNYIDRQFDVNAIDKVWFMVEPFTKFKAIAHTFFVFDFVNADPVAVSVEARVEKGEKYSAFKGIFNQYELIYLWGSETDESIRRIIFQNNKLYMYPLVISKQGAQELLLQLARTTHQLQQYPRFYNTLLSNCTNELAKAANKVKPGAIPLNIALILPGYSVETLYKLGYIPSNMSLIELENRYYISDIIKENYASPQFSKQLRIALQKK